MIPIYYVRKSLLSAKSHYLHLEKIVLALVEASHKLRPYFQCHPIMVVTTSTLWNILHKLKLLGRISKWSIKLRKFDSEYKSQDDHYIIGFWLTLILSCLCGSNKKMYWLEWENIGLGVYTRMEPQTKKLSWECS